MTTADGVATIQRCYPQIYLACHTRHPYELREPHPPDRVISAIVDPTLPFGGSWTYELAREGTGTRLTITERGEVRNPIFRFVSRLFMSPTATMEQFVAALRQRRG